MQAIDVKRYAQLQMKHDRRVSFLRRIAMKLSIVVLGIALLGTAATPVTAQQPATPEGSAPPGDPGGFGALDSVRATRLSTRRDDVHGDVPSDDDGPQTIEGV